MVLIGSRVLGRAFTEAYRQANASSQYARAQAKAGGAVGGGGGGSTGRANLSSGMTLDEAVQILNVPRPPPPPPANANANGGGAARDYNMQEVLDRFKRLFDANDPQKGGSFYLQSKVLRARERIEAEVGPLLEQAAQEAEVKAGFKPKMYKNQ